MKFWPLRTRENSPQRAYLFLDERGLGTLHVDRPQALTAMRALQRGELPDGAVLFPNPQLRRIRSRHDTTTVTAHLYRGRRQRFQLRSVTDRNQVMDSLRGHPAVKASTIKTTPLLHHSGRQLAMFAILGAVFWMSYQTALTTSSGSDLQDQLSFMGWNGVPVPALPYVAAVTLLLAGGYSVWRPRRSRLYDELLFQ
ncbi:hypothetical protein LEM8419_03285 [Neolewinella maritima]|uniref:Uncharacterized protein n=1 Tax=Neolewinella maritima TaxID=1383882 RepID=A0ABN8FDB1_9BACT|nr:hypothetical protein [Neolewinella maritima]CAH1002384.1 hypothetical protein LEM8419_03285 [Neolewinella maritima]